MANTRTLAELEAEILFRGDLRSVRHDPNGTELQRQINASILRIYRKLCKINKDYFLTSNDETIVSGTGEYSLPADFLHVEMVHVKDGSYWYPMKKFLPSEMRQYQASSGEKRLCRYRAMGSDLYLRPTPGWAGTVRLWYHPVPTELTDAAHTFDGICGYEELVILDVIVKMKAMDGLTDEIGPFGAQLKIGLAELEEEAAERDDNEPDRWRDPEAEQQATGWPY